jgi:hypothetical protein
VRTNEKATSDSKSEAASTRRRFMLGAGAAMSVPLSLSAESAPAIDHASAGLKARLTSFEDLAAIQELNSAYLRHFNAGAYAKLAGLFADSAAAAMDPIVTRLVATDIAQQGEIEIAVDRSTATLRLPCLVEIESPIAAPESTLVEMARLQGGGVLKTTEARVLELSCVNRGRGWQIGRAVLARK